MLKGGLDNVPPMMHTSVVATLADMSPLACIFVCLVLFFVLSFSFSFFVESCQNKKSISLEGDAQQVE